MKSQRNKKTAGMPSPQQSNERDENGRIIVNMNVGDDSNFLSMFSVTANPVISSEVAEFVEFSTRLLPPGADITLRIHSNCIDDQEKKIYTAAIKQFYQEQYIVIAKELRRNNVITMLLALAGIACLGLMFALERFLSSAIWIEVIDIVAWVFLWEAVDIRFFRNRKLKSDKLRYVSFMNMNIEYLGGDNC